MGELSEAHWTWESNDNYRRVGRVSVKGTVTPGELVDHICAITPGVNPADIRINFATAQWTRDAAEAEIAERQERARQRDLRHERWERQTLWRLLRKYGKSGALPPDERGSDG